MTAAADVIESDPSPPPGVAPGRAARWPPGRMLGRRRGAAPRKPPLPPGELPRWAQAPEPVGPAREAVGTMLTILAASLIGFAVWVAFGSRLYFDRVQFQDYASFRVPLANGYAP